MAFPLSPHVHLAVVDDDVVLLDVGADQYFCVPSGRDLLQPSAGRTTVSPPFPGALETLRTAGFIGSGAPCERPIPSKPGRDLLLEGRLRMTWRDALRLAAAVGDVLTRYRGRPLRDILGFVTKADLPIRPGDAAEVLRLAGLYRHAVVWLPIPRKCLIRSFVLLRWLQRSGVNAHWIFGVRTWPFSAHCWLQLADIALDESAERLVAYEPILAVG
jgi:transglutaminase superfamily protein